MKNWTYTITCVKNWFIEGDRGGGGGVGFQKGNHNRTENIVKFFFSHKPERKYIACTTFELSITLYRTE